MTTNATLRATLEKLKSLASQRPLNRVELFDICSAALAAPETAPEQKPVAWIAEWRGEYDVVLPKRAYDALKRRLATPQQAAPTGCVCGESTLGVVHRADGPCYWPDAPVAQQAAPEQATIHAGLELAARFIEKKAEAYDEANGTTDPETGTREWPGEGSHWLMEMDELADNIRRLAVPLPQQREDSDAAALGRIRMVLCPICGNKRCPHANDPANACTGSNEPGQPGSAYPVKEGKTT